MQSEVGVLFAFFSDAGVDGAKHAIEELVDRGELEMAAVTYLRGRSITGEFVIIDERSCRPSTERSKPRRDGTLCPFVARPHW